ncbi:PAS domain-containing sensor histidine kinase [Christiangramia salexigens]|uniref:histidine kinase n=1 Tax=Christiangramia salexigens TaxID=1913577 RepID=A0A1L3J682_9FLAO|nr:PAS domain-containing sensor histidine kinase [Christiangramia salexigens]APG60637.1 PAS domain-containing sensor histidine kinase [Christiangramia salexigens]
MEPANRIEILERALSKEKQARKAAENILEEKSSELHNLSIELKESNARLKELLNRKTSELEEVFENIIDAYVVIHLDGEVIKMNQAAVDLLGYDVKDKPFNLGRLVKKDYRNYTSTAFKKLLNKGRFNNYKAVIVPRNGEEKIVQINASLIYNKKGNPIAAQGIARDITEQTRIEELLEQQKKQLDIVYTNSPIGISLSKANASGLLMANQYLCDMLGYSRKELKSKSIQELTYPDDVEESTKLMQKMFNGDLDKFTTEKRYLTKHNTVVWARTSVTAVRTSKGDLSYQVATIEDITEQKIANERLRESENRMATLILNLQTGILLEDENRHILLINEKFCKMFNIPSSPEEMIGLDCKNIADDQKHLFTDPRKFVERTRTLLKNREIVLSEEIELANGRIYERSYIPIYNEGVYRGHLWSYDDATIRKRYKQNLKAQKEKYSSIIANMNLGLIEVDNEDHILMANQSFCDISGFSQDELRGKKAGDLFLLDESRNILKQKNLRRRKGISDSYEVKARTKNGEVRDWLISGAPNYDLKGQIIGSIGIHFDITNQKTLEKEQKELLQNLELQNEQLNDYAHIVSHDLKSPLRNISALLSWTMEDYKEKLDPKAMKNLLLIQEKTEQMDQLIEGILKYSGIDNTGRKNEMVNLNELVNDIISMIYVPEHIKIKIKNPLPVIFADVTRMQQLFQNLISNAVNYIDKEKGFVEIDVIKKGKKYIFSVSDNGCGIPKEYHEKIFKIFSSVKNDKKSTGIGLSIVKKILDLYDSEIWLESEPGVGSVFYFSLKNEV